MSIAHDSSSVSWQRLDHGCVPGVGKTILRDHHKSDERPDLYPTDNSQP